MIPSTNEGSHVASMTQLWLKSIRACGKYSQILTSFHNRQQGTKRRLCVFPAKAGDTTLGQLSWGQFFDFCGNISQVPLHLASSPMGTENFGPPHQGFSQNFWWGGGLPYRGRFFVPARNGVRWMGDLCRGRSQMRGDLEKLSTEAKNAPTAKLEQILVLSATKRAFWCSFELKSSYINWEKNEVEFLKFGGGGKTQLGGQALVKKQGQGSVGRKGKIFIAWEDPKEKKPAHQKFIENTMALSMPEYNFLCILGQVPISA